MAREKKQTESTQTSEAALTLINAGCLHKYRPASRPNTLIWHILFLYLVRGGLRGPRSPLCTARLCVPRVLKSFFNDRCDTVAMTTSLSLCAPVCGAEVTFGGGAFGVTLAV